MLKPVKSFIIDFHSRHRNNINRLSHLIGVPLVFFSIFRLFIGKWKIGLLIFFIGYLLQWIGHTYFEKNEMGEWILIKKVVNKWRGQVK